MKLKSNIKRLIPAGVWKKMHNLRTYISLRSYRVSARKAEKCIRKKDKPLNVLFFVVWKSMWKYDSLYKMMLSSPHFKPQIIVCTAEDRGDEDYMIQTMKQSAQYFESKGYSYICAYNEQTRNYIDPHQFNPDIIFYSSPYMWVLNERYHINKFKDSLICYVNYFYITNNESWSCAEDFHKSIWRYYLEYPYLLDMINNFYAPFKINGKVVGYPLFDSFRQYKVSDKDWPVIGKRKKRIIWAPHHTISGKTQINAFSTFEKYYDFMLKMAGKYKEELQIVFKPHPILKPNLYNAKEWGKERTDTYYDRWANGENTALEDGEYVGLFLASDAMIHDCNSFTVEYLAVNKPAMFLDSGMTDDKINEAGKEARACYYKGYCEKDIEKFIKMIIEGGEDELKEKREAFYKNYILPPNGKLAAENIIDDLLTSLGRK